MNGHSKSCFFILPGIFRYFSQFNNQPSFITVLYDTLKVFILPCFKGVHWDTRGLSNVSGLYGPKGCSEMGWSMNSLKLYKYLWTFVFSVCLCWVRQGVVEKKKVPLFSFSKGSVIHQNLESTSVRELSKIN